MAEPVLEMMALQGELRVYLMQQGIDQSKALDISGEILDKVLNSDVAKDEYKQAYAQLAAED